MLTAVGLAALAIAAEPAPWQWRVDGGADVDVEGHGVVDAGIRKGPGSIQLYTDTVDAQYGPDLAHGRVWAGVRVGAFASGLLLSQWTDGAPDPTKDLDALSAGPEVGALRYLPDGFYVGGQAMAKYWRFWKASSETAFVPPARIVTTVDGLFGVWRPAISGWGRVGVDVDGTVPEPHASVEATFRLPHGFGPYAAAHAGWGADQDFVTLTRLGGLTPYAVPLAGAGWAEFRVENYAAIRLGPTYGADKGWVALVADLDAFQSRPPFGMALDGQRSAGFAALGHVAYRRFFADLAAGGSPFLHHQPGYPPIDGWICVGLDWGPVARG